jgi:hypothetical protein
MADWIDDLADALSDRLGSGKRSLRLNVEQVQDLLEATRSISHSTDRTNAPLASYLVGRYVATRVAAGGDPDRALAEALNVVKRTLPRPRSI